MSVAVSRIIIIVLLRRCLIHQLTSRRSVLYLVPAQNDSFTAKRMRKIGQRKSVDYTSSIVKYIQYLLLVEESDRLSCNLGERASTVG